MKTVREALEEVCDASDTEAKIYENYSGRGMYGKTCIGVSCDRYDDIKIIERAAVQGLSGAKMDSLGMGTIVYWPEFQGDEQLVECERCGTGAFHG